jgi:hypothetical protein
MTMMAKMSCSVRRAKSTVLFAAMFMAMVCSDPLTTLSFSEENAVEPKIAVKRGHGRLSCNQIPETRCLVLYSANNPSFANER